MSISLCVSISPSAPAGARRCERLRRWTPLARSPPTTLRFARLPAAAAVKSREASRPRRPRGASRQHGRAARAPTAWRSSSRAAASTCTASWCPPSPSTKRRVGPRPPPPSSPSSRRTQHRRGRCTVGRHGRRCSVVDERVDRAAVNAIPTRAGLLPRLDGPRRRLRSAHAQGRPRPRREQDDGPAPPLARADPEEDVRRAGTRALGRRAGRRGTEVELRRLAPFLKETAARASTRRHGHRGDEGAGEAAASGMKGRLAVRQLRWPTASPESSQPSSPSSASKGRAGSKNRRSCSS